MHGDDILKAELKQAIAECERLRAENSQQAAASRFTEFTVPPEWQGIGIRDIYTALVNDESRTDLIVADVVNAIEDGRFPLLLSERTDLQILLEKLEKRVPNIFVMKGGMGPNLS